MKTLMVALAAAGFLVAPVSVNSLSAQQTDPQPTCRMCEGTYLPATEIQDYLKKGAGRETHGPTGARRRYRQSAYRHRCRPSRQA
jgi:hypothetical protein